MIGPGALRLRNVAPGRSLAELCVVAGGSVWTVVVMLGAADSAGPFDRLWAPLMVLPMLLLLAAALWIRPRPPRWLVLAAGWATTTTGAVVAAIVLPGSPYLAFVPIALAIATAVAMRWPVEAYLAGFLLAGTHASIKLYTGIPIGAVVDAALGGLLVGLVWSWWTGRREAPSWFPPALLLLSLFLVVTLIGVLFQHPLMRGFFAFRVAFWYMAAVPLVALAFDTERQLRRLIVGVMLLASVAIGYAMLRWVIGPGGREETFVRTVGTKYVVGANDQIRLVGALLNPQMLGAWCSVIIPFSAAIALSLRSTRIRLLGLGIVLTCGAAIGGTDTRVAMAATAAGIVTVLVLFAASRGHAGTRAGPLVVGLMIVVLGGGLFVEGRLSDPGEKRQRFEGLLNPTQDESFQGRLIKWRTILEDADKYPLGHGVGASGQAEQRYKRFQTAASFTPDSSYVKIAYDQGFVVLALFGAALIAMLGGLVQRALRARTALTAAVAIASAGSLVAFMIDMAAGEYIEGLQALVPWLLIGLGFTADRLRRDGGLSLSRR